MRSSWEWALREPLRNYDEAAAWLGVARSWLEAEVQAGRVSHTRLGKHVRFTQEHLDELIARGEERAVWPEDQPEGELRPPRRLKPLGPRPRQPDGRFQKRSNS